MPQNKDELLQELIDKYLKMYMKLAYNKGVPYEDVEDVVWDAFMSLYDSDKFVELQKANDEAGIKFLMARITINKCIDYYRKNSHMEQVSLDECVEVDGGFGKYRDNDPERMIINHENYERIRQCIEGMRDIWRDLAEMYFIEEQESAEICKILGISGDVFRSRLSRIRNYMREELKDIMESD